MSSALRELLAYTTNPIRLVLWVTITAACVMSGPFESGQAGNFWSSLIFWALAVGYGIFLGGAVNIVGRSFAYLGPVLTFPGMAVLFALFYGPFLAVSLPIFFPESEMYRDPAWLISIYAGAIFLVIMLIVMVITRSTENPPEETVQSTPLILKRLPAAIGTEVLRVSSQDHYVEVTTRLGKELVLMRFTDALEELSGLAGVRVHRSHWVAQNAVAKHRREGGRVFLVLEDGTEVPVSRSYRADAKAAGIL